MTINFLFTSIVKCLIKFNGKALGNCYNYPLSFSAPFFETAIIEILPFNENKNFCNQSFLINNAGVLSCQSPLVQITKFCQNHYGIHFVPLEIFTKSCLKAVYQQNYAEKNLHHSATVFYDGAYSLVTECEHFMETYILPEIFDIEVLVVNIPSACFLLKGRHKKGIYIKIIDFDDDYCVIYDSFVKEVKAENNKLYITEGFDDHMGHCLEKVYFKENKKLKIEAEKKLYTKGKDINFVNKALIPYIFIESIKSCFFEEKEILLTEELQAADIDYFKTFFGDYTEIMQNPVTKRLCLIKKINGNYFEAADYNFEFENGKISNVYCE